MHTSQRAEVFECVQVCVCTWAGQMASHSLQAMQRSSPEGYLRRDLSCSLLLSPPGATSVWGCACEYIAPAPLPAEGMLPSEAW